MSSSSRKEEIRRLREATEREAAMRAPRDAADEIDCSGFGIRRAQVIRIPSFESAVAFDVRDHAQWIARALPADSTEAMTPHFPDLRLYRSNGLEAGTRTVSGYRAVEMPHAALAALLERLRQIAVPIASP